MQEQTKRPAWGVAPQSQVAKPKDLLSQVPDITSVLAPPKNKRVVTRCGQCSDPNCRVYPVTVVVEDG